jgi:AraC family transcriptional regulator
MSAGHSGKNLLSDEVNVLGAIHSDQFSISLSDYCVGLRQSWHSHEQPILTLILAGYAREQVGCEDVTINPLQVGLKPAGLRHTDHFWPNGVRALRISLSPALISPRGSELQIIERWDWLNDSQSVRPLLRLAHCLRRAESNADEVMENIYDALAGLLPPTTSRCAVAAPLWLCRAREHLHTSYSQGIRLTHLAREADVHPVYFARQFRRFFGCSVGRYVRQLQFCAAAAMLAKRHTNLAQVACHVGFSDQAHMTRTFAREFGITPGQFRRIVS